jgi:hypothetical protein
MFGIAPRSDVQIRIVAQHSWRLHRIVLIVSGKFLQSVESFLVDQEALLDPTFNSGGRAHPGESLFAIQNFQALTVFYVAHTIEDGGNLVAQSRLWRRNVGDFQYSAASMAPGKQQNGHNRHPQNQIVSTE